MKYYVLRPSRNKKIIGHYPQTKSIKQNCDIWNEPRFIEKFEFQKIGIEPITANAILHNSSKVTDLIDVVGMGFTRKLLISDKLRKILVNLRKSGLQFFVSNVIYKGINLSNYWIMNLYEVNPEFIDFEKSAVFETNLFDKVKQLEIKSVNEFLEVKKEIDKKGYPNGILIDKVIIREQVSYDFFALLNVEGGVKYILSEKAKWEIEEADCTGIEFQPIELSLAEWLHGGEREKVYGKA